MTTLLTGGTGWIGGHLLKHLENPVVVSRNRERARDKTGLGNDQIIECDLTAGVIPRQQMPEVDTVINLMGDSVADGRWNPSKKQRIRNSRVSGTSHLVHSILQSPRLPRTYVAASAVGYYGDRGEQRLDEQATPGDGFLARVCVDWERQAVPLAKAGVRVCFLRIGIVLGQGGGAMARMLTPFRLGLGGRLGTGQQWMPWIHLDDLVELIRFVVDSGDLQGPLNATSPNPVRNSEFTKALAAAVSRPAILPVPRFALKLAVGDLADVLCASQRAVPAAAERHGFDFSWPSIREALQQIVR